jgi:16S rRNA (cytosine1407-C5)-methyltransferase
LTEISNNILSYISSLYGEEGTKNFIEFIHKDSAQYIRVNTIKTNKQKIAQSLAKDYSIATEEIFNLANALKIKSNNDIVGKTIEHIIGDYYIQSLSSMLPPLILSPGSNDVVLDLCAAPGSKTTELGEMMQTKLRSTE